MISADVERKIRLLEMWTYRRMMRISHKDHIRNESILVGLCEMPKLMRTIKQRKYKYFGHVLRGEGHKYQRLLLKGRVNGKRGRGRPWNTRFRDISKWMQIDYVKAARCAQDRERWRTMVSEVQGGYGTSDCD